MASNVPECLIRFKSYEDFDKAMKFVYVERLVASDGGLVFHKHIIVCWNGVSAQAVVSFCIRNGLSFEAYHRTEDRNVIANFGRMA